MKYSTFFIWTFIILLYIATNGCYDVYSNSMLKFANSSNYDVGVLETNQKSGDLTVNQIDYYISEDNMIPPNSTHTIFTLGKSDAWHNYIQSGPEKKLFIYVFNVDTLKKYRGSMSMNDLVAVQKYSKLLQYSEKDLIANHWVINFK